MSKYEVGLEKLTTTETSVEGMKRDLIALQPQLVEKNKEVGEMMVVVNEESAKTEKVKEVRTLYIYIYTHHVCMYIYIYIYIHICIHCIHYI